MADDLFVFTGAMEVSATKDATYVYLKSPTGAVLNCWVLAVGEELEYKPLGIPAQFEMQAAGYAKKPDPAPKGRGFMAGEAVITGEATLMQETAPPSKLRRVRVCWDNDGDGHYDESEEYDPKGPYYMADEVDQLLTATVSRERFEVLLKSTKRIGSGVLELLEKRTGRPATDDEREMNAAQIQLNLEKIAETLMTEERARQILGVAPNKDESLSQNKPWIAWTPGPRFKDTIELDGNYTIEQIEALLWWMRNKAEK